MDIRTKDMISSTGVTCTKINTKSVDLLADLIRRPSRWKWKTGKLGLSQPIIRKKMSSYMCRKKCRKDINRTRSCSLSRRAVKRRVLARQVNIIIWRGWATRTGTGTRFKIINLLNVMQIVYFQTVRFVNFTFGTGSQLEPYYLEYVSNSVVNSTLVTLYPGLTYHSCNTRWSALGNKTIFICYTEHNKTFTFIYIA